MLPSIKTSFVWPTVDKDCGHLWMRLESNNDTSLQMGREQLNER